MAFMERQILDLMERYSREKRLEPYADKAFSQRDEDGLIAEIFQRIGTTDRRFVQFGCGDGLENNTAYLLYQGWSLAGFSGIE